MWKKKNNNVTELEDKEPKTEAVESEEIDEENEIDEIYEENDGFSYRHPFFYGIFVAFLTFSISAGLLYLAYRVIPRDMIPWIQELILEPEHEQEQEQTEIKTESSAEKVVEDEIELVETESEEEKEPLYEGEITDDGILVPDLSGRTKEETETLLNSLGLGAKYKGESISNIPAGCIVDQDPAPRTQVEKNTTVYYHTSIGPTDVKLPEIMNVRLYDAIKTMEAEGIENITVVKEHSDTVKLGLIMASNPEQGKTISTADPVVITVSAGLTGKEAKSSDYIGMKLDEALNLATEDGFIPTVNYGYSNITKPGLVMAQSVERNCQCDYGSEIVLTVCSKEPPKNGKTYEFELNAPNNLTDAGYRFVFIQESDMLYETMIESKDTPCEFPYRIQIKDVVGTGKGIIRYDEKTENGYVHRALWAVDVG